jgi:hypothetical protein
MQHHDFELYTHEQEQQLQYLPTTQPFLPSSTYSMEQSFSAPYEHSFPLVEAPRPQYTYEQFAQEHKLASQYNYHSPSGSPHSTLNSFQDQPPVLSASSESGASASSSALGSPSITPQFEMEAWNPMAMMTSGIDFPTMVAEQKSFVGESMIPSETTTSFPSSASTASSNAFKTPTTPASAGWSLPKRSRRRNSLLSNEIFPHDTPTSPASSVTSSPLLLRSSSTFKLFSPESCRFPPCALSWLKCALKLTHTLQTPTSSSPSHSLLRAPSPRSEQRNRITLPL